MQSNSSRETDLSTSVSQKKYGCGLKNSSAGVLIEACRKIIFVVQIIHNKLVWFGF
jgi:hypothetical protein